MKITELALLGVLLSTGTFAATPSPCARLNAKDRMRISWHLMTVEPESDAVTISSLGSRHDEPEQAMRCILYLAKNCPNESTDASGKLDPLCVKAREEHGPLMLIMGLCGGQGACPFLKSAEDVIREVSDPLTRMRWCFYYAGAGGRDLKCLDETRPEFLQAMKMPDFKTIPGHPGMVDGNDPLLIAKHYPHKMSFYASNFAHPRYVHLLPWLKSLPRIKGQRLSDALQLAVAAQSRNREQLLQLVARGHWEFLDKYIAWTLKLFPQSNVLREAKRRGADRKRINRIEGVMKYKADQLERTIKTEYPFCESTSPHSSVPALPTR